MQQLYDLFAKLVAAVTSKYTAGIAVGASGAALAFWPEYIGTYVGYGAMAYGAILAIRAWVETQKKAAL